MATDKNPVNTGTGNGNQTSNTGSNSFAAMAKDPKVAAMLAKMGAGSSGTAQVTSQDADYIVQSVYQQMLGRNAAGQEYARALSAAMSQDQATGTYGRMQAVMNAVQQSPEYQMELEDKYMDAAYNAVAASARKVQA